MLPAVAVSTNPYMAAAQFVMEVRVLHPADHPLEIPLYQDGGRLAAARLRY
jgi:hypothetical protein